jgi:hypothetical protein
MMPNVIPQSPPIKVRVSEVESNSGKVTSRFGGLIVAWQVREDADGDVEMEPVVWQRNAAQTLISAGDYHHVISPADEWEF